MTNEEYELMREQERREQRNERAVERSGLRVVAS
jgi:hypothetical protein